MTENSQRIDYDVFENSAMPRCFRRAYIYDLHWSCLVVLLSKDIYGGMNVMMFREAHTAVKWEQKIR